MGIYYQVFSLTMGIYNYTMAICKYTMGIYKYIWYITYMHFGYENGNIMEYNGTMASQESLLGIRVEFFYELLRFVGKNATEKWSLRSPCICLKTLNGWNTFEKKIMFDTDCNMFGFLKMRVRPRHPFKIGFSNEKNHPFWRSHMDTIQPERANAPMPRP